MKIIQPTSSIIIAFASVIATITNAAPHENKCSSKTIDVPQLLGAQFLKITAAEVWNFSSNTPELGGHLPGLRSGLDFCNVTVTYTHPGQNDTINVQVWLPLHDWNGKFQGAGGGGWSGSLGPILMAPAIASGYAVAASDLGHETILSPTATPESWAQISPGNVNMYLLEDFAHVGLNDMTVIGKSITKSYYGRPPSYSYWFGCSTGGRQGLMLAQRYPTAYDGILASAPAINWAKLLVANYWPQQIMKQINAYPSQCELSALTDEAIKACDELDGFKDGIIGAPELCDFDPSSVIGKPFHCTATSEEMTFSSDAAIVASAAWTGPRSINRNIYGYGLSKDANLLPLTASEKNGDGTVVGKPFSMSDDWVRLFVTKDPAFDMANMTEAEFFSILHSSMDQYDSIISANNPDLTDFRAGGRKMITWHGLADELIPPGSTENYYKGVLRLDPRATDFYRYFEAPGVGHCGHGTGHYPYDALDKLVKWVENGEEPDTITGIGKDDTTREICHYPLVQRYIKNDHEPSGSFQCVDRRGTTRALFKEQP